MVSSFLGKFSEQAPLEPRRVQRGLGHQNKVYTLSRHFPHQATLDSFRSPNHFFTLDKTDQSQYNSYLMFFAFQLRESTIHA